LRTCQLTLIYSTSEHGTSLHTFYRQAQEYDGPSLLIVADSMGGVFGCFAPVTWKPSLHAYGTGEAFLFTLLPDIRIYPWSRDTSSIMVSNMNQLAMGTGYEK
jgi:hypothetical protein